MTIKNFLKNKDDISIKDARDIIEAEALRRNTIETMQEFERNYKQTYTDYYADFKLRISATSFQLELLESFKPWLEELIKQDNIQMYMPLIITKMLYHDPLSLSIYEMIYQKLGKDDVLISQNTFDKHPELEDALSHSDMDVGTVATVNAIHWINSDEGHIVLCNGVFNKESIESLLGSEC